MPAAKQVLMGLLGFLWLGGSCASSCHAREMKEMAPGTHQVAVMVDGVERRYIVHVPSMYDPTKNWPVVIMFHGGGGTAKFSMWETGWNDKAETAGFLAVFPDGTSPNPSRPARFRDNPQTWNDGSERSNVGAVRRGIDDVRFISMLVADIESRLNIDKHRMYATGFSNGASMAFRVARELSTVFAAVAPVAGSDWLVNRPPLQPIPLMYLTGTADPLNPFHGGEIHLGGKTFGAKTPVQMTIDHWVRMLGCSPVGEVVYDSDGATGTAYRPPGGTAQVVLYTFEGHGHHWPGGRSVLPERMAGKNTAKLKATDIIWSFFQQHPKDTHIASPQGAPGGKDSPRC